MPLITLHTNTKIDDEAQILDLMTETLAGELGKPKAVTMALIESEASLSMGGDSESNAALFVVEGIELSSKHAEPLTLKFTELAKLRLETEPSRVFVKFNDVPRGMWGGCGKVF